MKEILEEDSPWLWISSYNMQSLLNGKFLYNSAVETGGGTPKLLGVALERKILMGLYYEGKMYDYNFSNFWIRSKVNFEFLEGENINCWKVNASNKTQFWSLHLNVLKMKCY